jgi:cell division septum initiation protein DivIVA
MIEKTVGEIEAKIRGADSLDGERQREVLELLAALKMEIAVLQKTHAAAREKQQSLEHSVQELRSSVAGFEQSHPKLVQIVNSISNTLSNLGI